MLDDEYVSFVVLHISITKYIFFLILWSFPNQTSIDTYWMFQKSTDISRQVVIYFLYLYFIYEQHSHEFQFKYKETAIHCY